MCGRCGGEKESKCIEKMRVMNKRVIILFFLIIGCVIVCRAETEALVVALKDYSKVEFCLSESPRVKFDTDKIIVSSKTLSGEYPISTVRSVYFAKIDATSIKQIEKNTLRIIYDGHSVYTIKGLDRDDEVRVYDMSGRQIVMVSSKNKEAVVVSLQDNSKGVYIINVGGKHSFKVVKR